MRRFVALACVLAIAGTACAQTKATGFPPPIQTESEATSPSPTGSGGGGGYLTGPIDIVDSAFEPRSAKVKVGTTVEWVQSGSEPHSVTFDDGSFDSSPDCPPVDKCTQAGDEVTFKFEKAGTVPYYCKIHGAKGGIGMAGEIVVE